MPTFDSEISPQKTSFPQSPPGHVHLNDTKEVVITGVGVVSPIGIGREPFWSALREGRSGVGRIRRLDASHLPIRIAAEIEDFDPKAYVRPRKSLKVMCLDAQFGVAASVLACRDAGISADTWLKGGWPVAVLPTST